MSKFMNWINSLAHKVKKAKDITMRSRPPEFDTFLKKYGDNIINKISICREPLKDLTKMVLNGLTNHRLDKIKSKYNYDDVFHLFMIINDKIRFEFRGVIKAKIWTDDTPPKNVECKTMVVPAKQRITWNAAIKKVEKQNPKVYQYSGKDNNCQTLIRDFVHTLKINKYDSFIMQNVKDLFKDKRLRRLSNSVTDLTGLGNVMKQRLKRYYSSVKSQLGFAHLDNDNDIYDSIETQNMYGITGNSYYYDNTNYLHYGTLQYNNDTMLLSVDILLFVVLCALLSICIFICGCLFGYFGAMKKKPRFGRSETINVRNCV
eukprot:141393_1